MGSKNLIGLGKVKSLIRYDNTLQGAADLLGYVAMVTAWDGFYGNPAAMLSLIPLYEVQVLEVGRSEDILKYRAVGGQFLAQQRGGHVSVKIVMYLRGSEGLGTLSALQTLHEYGAEVERTSTLGGGATGKLVDRIRAKVTSSVAGTTASNLDPADETWKTKVYHKTFPIITREEVLYDMYIESLIYERNVADGKAIKITILCRHYVEPPDILTYGGVNIGSKIPDDATLASATTGIAGAPGAAGNAKVKIPTTHTKLNLPVRNSIRLLINTAHRALGETLYDKSTEIELQRDKIYRKNDGWLNGVVAFMESSKQRDYTIERAVINNGLGSTENYTIDRPEINSGLGSTENYTINRPKITKKISYSDISELKKSMNFLTSEEYYFDSYNLTLKTETLRGNVISVFELEINNSYYEITVENSDTISVQWCMLTYEDIDSEPIKVGIKNALMASDSDGFIQYDDGTTFFVQSNKDGKYVRLYSYDGELFKNEPGVNK